MVSTYQILIQSIDPTTLEWEKWITFGSRTYYWTEDVQPLDITAVSVDGEAVGKVLVDLQREIRVDCTEGQALISLPIESADYPNEKLWISNCQLEEALWVAKWLAMTILFVQERDAAGYVSRGYKVSNAGGLDFRALDKIM